MSTEQNKDIQQFVARIEATLKARNPKRFAHFDSARKQFVEKLPEQGYYYFHMLADVALIEGFIHAEWWAGDNPEYKQFLDNVLKSIREAGNKINSEVYDDWQYALETLALELGDSMACITALRNADGSINFDTDDTYSVYENECAQWNWDDFKDQGNYCLTPDKEWNDKLDGYSANALWGDMRFNAYFCEKYVKAP